MIGVWEKYWRVFFWISLFVFAVCIRWYHLDRDLFFGFEQGRDAQIVKNIYEHHDFKLVGPKTDIAGIFHGAYYYYILIIPSLLSHGNPLALSFFLVLISSTVPLIMYFFGRDVFHSEKWAIIIALLSAVSFEFITYARWLSNVSPSIPLIILTYYFLWLFHAHQKNTFFFFASICAAAASQFEIILVLQFTGVLAVLWLTKMIVIPKWKVIGLSIFICTIIFLPHLLFNVRNHNIMFTSIMSYASQSKGPLPIITNLRDFGFSYQTLFRKSLSLPNNMLMGVAAALIILGLMLRMLKEKRTDAKFFFIWLIMPFPILFFHDVAHLDQLYLGVGGAIIFLFVMACQSLWQYQIGRITVGILAVILLLGWQQTFWNLSHNKDLFFITIQEGLNYADQTKLLTAAHTDAQGKVYRFAAFTIPYGHPEGWQYIQEFMYPHQTDDGAKTVYIAIEKQVDPFWEKQWIQDFGPSQLVEEKQFGILRLQKRQLTTK